MKQAGLGCFLAVVGLVAGSEARAGDCELHTGTSENGIRPVRIACEWSDVDADSV
jgi:hypothetical protein